MNGVYTKNNSNMCIHTQPLDSIWSWKKVNALKQICRVGINLVLAHSRGKYSLTQSCNTLLGQDARLKSV